MTEPESTALVPQQQGGLTLGQQHLTGENLVLPRVKIVQQMSEERSSGLAAAGNFWNTLLQEDLGESIRFVPVLPFMTRVLLVRDARKQLANEMLEAAGMDPLTEGDGLKCRSNDMYQGLGEPGILCNECPLSKWHGKGNQEPPPCSEVYNVAALTELGDFVIFQFQRSGAKAGKRFFSMLHFANVAPWSRFYEVSTREDKIPKVGAFFVPIVNRTSEAPPTELMAQAKAWREQLGGRIIDVTPVEDEDLESGVTGSTEAKEGDKF